MKTIIAGSRSITDFDKLLEAMKWVDWEISEVVSGKCPEGVDVLGEDFAESQGIPVTPFPAQWRDEKGKFDKRAGFKRNTEMAEYADRAVILWDSKSKGALDMIKKAQNYKVRYVLYEVPSDRISFFEPIEESKPE